MGKPTLTGDEVSTLVYLAQMKDPARVDREKLHAQLGPFGREVADVFQGYEPASPHALLAVKEIIRIGGVT